MDNTKKLLVYGLAFAGLMVAAWMILTHLFSIAIAAVGGLVLSEVWDAAKQWVAAHKASAAAAAALIQTDLAKLPAGVATVAQTALTGLENALEMPKPA